MKHRLLLIGFPKSGTTTVHRAMYEAGLVSAHYKWQGQLVAKLMRDAFMQGRDPLDDLPECVTQCDATSVIDNMCYWPQLVLSLLMQVRKANRRMVIALNTRNVDDLIASIDAWKDFRFRLTIANLPGLPSGVGYENSELRAWIEGHYKRCRDLFHNDPHFIEFDIAAPDARDRLSEALQIKLPWWGIENANRSAA